MNNNPLLALKHLGQQVWLDNLSRTLLHEGTLKRLIDEFGVSGVTSNPSIFQKALTSSPYYRDEIERLLVSGLSPEERYETLVIADIQAACDLLAPVHTESKGEAGYVSLEVSPLLAHDMNATEAAANRLCLAVSRSNLLVKVPATPAGIIAFENLTATGLRVNVTLIFSLAQYHAVAQAYIRGAQRWMAGGGDAASLRSVASIFLSRVDTLVDQRLEVIGNADARRLKGKSGVALAKRCYQDYLDLFHGPRFSELAKAGAWPQTLLWASTGGKNPAYSDLLYVEPLIGPETITTLPDTTLAAFRQHGEARPTLVTGMTEARAQLESLAKQRLDLTEIGETLQMEGLRLFIEAYEKIISNFN